MLFCAVLAPMGPWTVRERSASPNAQSKNTHVWMVNAFTTQLAVTAPTTAATGLTSEIASVSKNITIKNACVVYSMFHYIPDQSSGANAANSTSLLAFIYFTPRKVTLNNNNF
jgi:hypothetical protein